MKRLRLHLCSSAFLAAFALAAAAGCGGGTRSCKSGTLFVTIVFDGTTSAADAVDVGVAINGGAAKTTHRSRTAGGTSDSVEINFPHGYPTGARVDVQVTAYMGSSPIATKTGTVASLADGCDALTVTLEPGSAGTGGMGGTGGAAGRGGAGGSTSGAAGRGGTSGGSAGTGGGTAGTVGSAGTGGRGGTGGSSAGTGGGTAGRGGTGGGTGGTGGPQQCRFASFDTGSDGFILSPYDTAPGNLLFREGGTPASMMWTNAEGDPTPGSLKIDAPYGDYNQRVNVVYAFTSPRNWANTRLHVRAKIASGLDQVGANPPGVQPYATSGSAGHFKGNWITVTVGHGWGDYVVDLVAEGDFDPTQIGSVGVTIDAGNGLTGSGTPNPVKPNPAMIYVDSFWLEGACTGGTGGFGGSTGGAGGSGGGCAASDPPPSVLISDFSMMDGGTAVVPIGGPFVYGVPVSPTAVVQNGAWHVTLAVPGMTAAQYTGVGIYFNGNAAGTDCLNAAGYSGIRFKIAGAVTGTNCVLSYIINDSQHAAVSATDPKASGPAGSYSPQVVVPPSQITAAGQTVTIPFTGVGSPTGGSPATPIDPTRLTGVQWQFAVPAGTANACNADVTLDDVTFVP